MKRKAFAALALLFAVASGEAQTVPLLRGATLPVELEHSLDARHAIPRQPIAARLLQRVPLGSNTYLPSGAEVLGTAECDGKVLRLSFGTVRVHGQTAPVHVELVAAADWLDVEQTKVPLGAPDRGTANPAQWTTMQIGRDEVYLANSRGTVYDQYSRPVGRADGTGVYAPPIAAGSPERAMGPFSTTAAGLYDMRGLTLRAQGPPVILNVVDPKWRMHAHDALLLQVVAP